MKVMRCAVFTLIVSVAVAEGQDLLDAGRKALERGEYAEAERLFRRQVAKTPGSAEALSDLGTVLAREDRFDEAVLAYRRALKADPRLVPIYFNLGVAYFRAGRYQEAIGPFEQFLQTRPNDPRARQLRAVSLIEAAQYKRGIAELEELSRERPNDPAILFALAGAHIRLGDETRGRELMEQLHGLNLPPAPVHLLRGMLLYRAEQYDDAEKELEEALRLEPRSSAALAALGRLRLRVNDDSAAIDYFQKALAIQPQDWESNYQLGVLLGRRGQEERARKYLLSSLEQRANYPDPMYFLGKLELSQNHPLLAVKWLEKAATLAPKQESIRFLLARAYKQAGQDGRAKAETAEFRRLQQQRLQRDRKAMDPAQPPDPTRAMDSEQEQ